MNINVDFAKAAGGGFPSFAQDVFEPLLPRCGSFPPVRPCSTVAILSHWQKIVWCLNRMLFTTSIWITKRSWHRGFRLVHGLGVVIGAGVVSEGRSQCIRV